jgi:hypothetical protein
MLHSETLSQKVVGGGESVLKWRFACWKILVSTSTSEGSNMEQQKKDCSSYNKALTNTMGCFEYWVSLPSLPELIQKYWDFMPYI